MKLKIKTKLYLGLGLLTVMILTLWGSGAYFLNTLSNHTRTITKDNNRSVAYAQAMEQALTNMLIDQEALLQTGSEPAVDSASLKKAYDTATKTFREQLHLQQANITEVGERVLVRNLTNAFNKYVTTFDTYRNHSSGNPADLYPLYQQVMALTGQVGSMNLDAINRKNAIALSTSTHVVIYMMIVGGLCTILALILFLRFPTYITRPINELKERILDIANHHYDKKLHFTSGDEFEELGNAFNRMAERLQEFESSNMARLLNEKKRIETIINHMKDAIIGLDARHNVLFANTTALTMLALSKDNVIGKYAPDIASSNDIMRELIKDLVSNSSSQQDTDNDFIRLEEDGKSSYYSKELLPIRTEEKDGKRDHIGDILVLRNVTYFKELSEAKTNFMSVISHELKTPLASIGMSLRLLGDERIGSLNAEQRKLVHSIGNDSRRMKETTAELLDLSRIESGNIELNIQTADPAEVFAYAYETMSLQAYEKKVKLESKVMEKLPPIRADVQKTAWVLVNLVSNALRYTEPGGSIVLMAHHKHGTVVFSVRDTGIGIAKEYLDKIFERYFQVPVPDSGKDGTGLGLTIAREFITAQGGKIWAESEPGKGSTFYFTMPVVE